MLKQNRFVLLLIALSLLLLVTPVLGLLGLDHYPRFLSIATAVLFVVMLVAAVAATSRSRSSILICVLLAAPAIVLCGFEPFVDSRAVLITKHAIGSVFIAYVIVISLRYLFTDNHVTVDTICASLCVYLLLGVCWSSIHVLIEVLEPGSYQLPGHGPEARFADFALYYSFVTMTTLGYGDVIPSSSSTRMFATTEAIMGQLYIAVLVARLVGLHIAQAKAVSR